MINIILYTGLMEDERKIIIIRNRKPSRRKFGEKVKKYQEH